MANLLVPLFSRRQFSFTGLTASTSADIILVRALPVFEHVEVTLLLKVHSVTLDGGARIDVIARESSPCDEDPSLDFVASSNVLSAAITTATAPVLIDASNSGVFGGHLRMFVRGTRGTSGDCLAVLEADLILKE